MLFFAIFLFSCRTPEPTWVRVEYVVPGDVEQLVELTAVEVERSLAPLKARKILTTVTQDKLSFELLVSADDAVRVVSNRLTLLPVQPLVTTKTLPIAELLVKSPIHGGTPLDELGKSLRDVGFLHPRLTVDPPRVFRLPPDTPISASELPSAQEWDARSFLAETVHDVPLSMWGELEKEPSTLGVESKNGRSWWVSLRAWPGRTSEMEIGQSVVDACNLQTFEPQTATAHGELYHTDPEAITQSVKLLKAWLSPWATDWVIAHGTGPEDTDHVFADHVEFWAWGEPPTGAVDPWVLQKTGPQTESWWLTSGNVPVKYKVPARDIYTLKVLPTAKDHLEAISVMSSGKPLGRLNGDPLIVRWGADIKDATDLGQRPIATLEGEQQINDLARVNAGTTARVAYRFNGKEAMKLTTSVEEFEQLKANPPKGWELVHTVAPQVTP